MKNERIALVLTFAFLLAVLTVSSFAQDTTQQPPAEQPDKPVLHQREQPATVTVNVKEVNLLANVRDKKGQLVNTLDKKDFVLEQDGHTQAITQFARDTDLPLTFGVLADTGPGQRKAMADERKAGTDFVNKLREDKDKAFVLHFDKEVELLQDVTASHDKLAKGIDAISIGEQQGSGNGRGRDQTDPDHPHYYFGGSMLYDAVYLSSSEVLKPLQGRKAVVLFSDGVDRGSKTTLTRAIESAQKANTLVYCVYVTSEREQEQNNGYPGGGRHGGGYPGGGGPFPGGGYPGGRGRMPPQQPREDKTDGKKILQQIARETGGRYFELSKKLTAADIYGRITEDMKNQYSLSYTPGSVESGYHKLHLSTTNSELTVQTREGFYAE